MKKWQKLSAILIALVLMLSLVACGASEEKQLVGTWTTELDISSAINDQLAALQLGSTPDVALIMPMVLTLKEDNTYTFSADADKFADSFTDYMEAYKDILKDAMYAEGESSNMTRDEFDAAMAEMYGMNVPDYIDAMFEQMNLESMFDGLEDEMTETGVWKAADGKLFIEEAEADFSDDNYVSYKLDGSKLTFESVTGDTLDLDELEDMGISLPLVFSK